MELLTQQILAGISTGAIYACMALAVVMIYQAIDHLNFAQGEMAMFSTFIAWQLIEKGVPYWLAFIITVVVSFIGGVAIERIVFKPIEHAPVLSHVVIFIALYSVINSMAGFIWDFTVKSFPSPFGSMMCSPTDLEPRMLVTQVKLWPGFHSVTVHVAVGLPRAFTVAFAPTPIAAGAPSTDSIDGVHSGHFETSDIICQTRAGVALISMLCSHRGMKTPNEMRADCSHPSFSTRVRFPGSPRMGLSVEATIGPVGRL